MTHFIPGLELNRLFFAEAVRPILDVAFPGLDYAAARIDSGSEVLGYDTPQSTDHDWGPRLQLFLSEEDQRRYGQAIVEALGLRLPARFRGFSTHFGRPDAEGTRLLETVESGPISHRITVHTVAGFFRDYLGLNPLDPLGPIDWLLLPQQRLLTVTAGAVYHDGAGQLGAIRRTLAYYPHDVWLYLLAAQWRRIGQEEAFVARCGDVGDELGSQVLAARQVRDLMLLCFLMERRYAPYSKWFGTAFAQLAAAARLTPIFHQVFAATDWREREAQLSQAYRIAAERHNALALTPPLPSQVSRFHNRPYLVIHADRFADALKAAIKDETVRQIPEDIGAVDQFADSTDALTRPWLLQKLRALYAPRE